MNRRLVSSATTSSRQMRRPDPGMDPKNGRSSIPADAVSSTGDDPRHRPRDGPRRLFVESAAVKIVSRE